MGVIVEKTRDGNTTLGIARSTFLIDPKGRILHVWPNVTLSGHAAEVFASLP